MAAPFLSSVKIDPTQTHQFFQQQHRRTQDKAQVTAPLIGCRFDPSGAFVFAGAGPRLAEVKRARERDGLENIRFLDYVPRSHLHM